MRTKLSAVALVVLAGTAVADDNVAGTYDVKFEEMASNCSPPPVAMGRGKLRIDVKKNSLTVNVDLIPQMVGVPAKGGKIKANTKEAVGSTVQGLNGKYSVAGRLEDGILQLVLVAEYTKQADGKPYCTQSWNVNGVPSKDKPDKAPEKKWMETFVPSLGWDPSQL